jgi:hypothetical protein
MNEKSKPMKEMMEAHLTPEQRGVLSGLSKPVKIQAFLDSCAYAAEDSNRSPVQVLVDRQAHCLDGGLFAAAALRRLGYPPLLVDLFPDPGMDDDHVLAVFERGGRYGAVAKSNFVGLRYRDPVYGSLRELIMSYFEQYFNINGIKTLRSYTLPVDLTRYDGLGWEWSEAGADEVEKVLLAARRFPLLTKRMVDDLAKVDDLTYRAGLLAVNMDGVYKPRQD